MRIRLGFLASLSFLWSCSHSPPDCSKFINGTFIVNYYGHTDIIKRTGNVQLEYQDTSKVPDVFAVKWVNGHTYTMVPVKVSDSDVPKNFKNPVQTVTITAVGSNYYTETSTSNYSTVSETEDIFKVN